MTDDAGQQIIVIGINPTGKVPASLFAVNYGVGLVSVGAVPRFLLLVGQQSGGTATPDTQVTQIYPSTNVAALYGARSELAQMIYAAQKTPGVQIKAISCAAPSGSPTAASLTITFANAATIGGTWTYYVAGQAINVNVAAGDTAAAQATNAAAQFNANPTIPCTAAAAGAVVTLTIANAGLRGNDWTLYQDVTLAPATTTSTLASASSYTVSSPSGGVTGVRFGGGAGLDNVTNALATLAGTQYYTTAWAQNDTGTNVPLIKAYDNAKAQVGSQLYEHCIFGENGLYSTAQTLSAALNMGRAQIGWCRGSEDHPSVIAAALGALRTQYDQVNPNQRMDAVALNGLHPQRAKLDRPSAGETGEQETALENGVTPITSTDDGYATVVRSITTLCSRNGSPFYGCIDTGQARTPDTAAEQLMLAWASDFSVSNPWVNSDPAANEKARPSGVATPAIWSAYANNLLSAQINNNWFSNVAVTSQFDSTTNQILTQISLTVTPQNHRVAGNVNQTF